MELAETMRINRASIREVFNQPKRDGFLKFIPQKGARVTPLSIKEIEDILEIRKNLELLALIKLYTKIPLKKLNQIANQFKQYHICPLDEPNILKYFSLDKEFHDLLADYYDNHMLFRLLKNIKEKILWLRSFLLDKLFFQSVEEHLAIIKAIQNQDKNLMSHCSVAYLPRAKEATIKEMKIGQMEKPL